MSMPRAPFITFEGTEGCGKSTQVQRLAARFESLGVRFLVTREPGGTPIGETVRELLQYAPQGRGMFPETELLLFEASRSQLVREVIKPALESGTWVISDRFFDSTTAYQGAARRLVPAIIDQLNAFAVGDCVPDLTLILDVDERTAQARMRKPRKPDRMEQEPAEFYQRVREAYRELARRQNDRVVLLDGGESADDIESRIWELIRSRFPELLGQAGQSAVAKAGAPDRNPQSTIRSSKR
jgi:dTMP kinase